MKEAHPHRILALDGVRAVAVSAVLLYHLTYGRFCGGFLGVDLFFVLSGFLITGLLLREFTESGSIRLDLFYWRRLYRIMPPVVVVLLLVSALRPLTHSYASCQWTEGYWTSMASVFFFFANFIAVRLGPLGHTWSLSIEEQFYLIWPLTLLGLLGYVRRRYSLPLLVGALVVLCALLRAYLEFIHFDTLYLYRFTPVRIDSLLVGAMAAMASGLPRMDPLMQWLGRFRIPELILLAFFTLGLAIDIDCPFLYYGGFTLVAAFFALLLLCTVHEKEQRLYLLFLRWTPVVWLGKRSYGIYLYHLPIFYALEMFRTNHSLVNFVLVSIARLSLTLGFAMASYHFIELPLLRHKTFLNWRHYRKETGASVPPAEASPLMGETPFK